MMRTCSLLGILLVSAGCASPRAGHAPTTVIASNKLFSTSPAHFDQLMRSSGGLPTVVNVWASWCIPCRAEAPRFAGASKRYAGKVRFIGLDTQDTNEDGLRFMKAFGIPYPSATDPSGDVAKHLRVLGLPTTLFFRSDGQLAFVHNGEIRSKDLNDKIVATIEASNGTRGQRPSR